MNLLFLLQIDKQNLLEVKLIESAEIDVGPIDNEDAVRFKARPSSRNDVMGFSIGDNHTARDVSPMIQEGMNLDCSLSLSELGPLEKAEAETDGRGVECVERIFEGKLMMGRFGQTLLVQNPKGLLKNPRRAPLVGICQGRTTDIADPQMVEPLEF